MKRVLIHAEIIDGILNPVCFQLLSKTYDLFEKESCRTAFLVTCSDVGNELPSLMNSGVDELYLLEDSRFNCFDFDTVCKALTTAIESFKPDIYLIGATTSGEEIAPTMGIRLNTGVAAHCMDIQVKEDGRLAYLVPAFGGKVVGEIFIPKTNPQIASIKPGIFKAVPQKPTDTVLWPIDYSSIETKTNGIEVLSVHRQDTCFDNGLENANIVLGGGYGMEDKQNWERLEYLATLLKGAVGCTRPAIDRGLTDNESIMIGTSGRTIRPHIYIGFGISGAMHHLCGIKDSGIIISINHDDSADIFKSSDFYAVANSRDIIDSLIDSLTI